MNKLLFSKYIKLQQQVSELEKEKKKLAQQCILEMKNDNLNRLDDDLGTFSLMERKFYRNYSDKVKELEENIKIVKEVEQNEGIAEMTIIESLRFQRKVEKN